MSRIRLAASLRIGLGTVLVALCLAPAGSAKEASEVRITGSRVYLRDVMASCPERACAADLGPAPPAGSSRWVAADAIKNALSAAGEQPAHYPDLAPKRVISASRVWSPAELGELLRPNIERKLSPGVRLIELQPKTGATLPLLASAGECSLPALPKRAGPVTTTVTVEILHEGSVVKRMPVQVRLELSEKAARPLIARGSVVTLVVERGAATVSARGVALSDAELGQLVPFRVQPTGRVVQAR
ncbi:MAG TPA: flagella basal body P-ring formation protein FlgA, partial [Polyangiaceae bacterium]|nr:flagella basal body P-ring formation protein FlgA [Polyangiaceae bacterium]